MIDRVQFNINYFFFNLFFLIKPNENSTTIDKKKNNQQKHTKLWFSWKCSMWHFFVNLVNYFFFFSGLNKKKQQREENSNNKTMRCRLDFVWNWIWAELLVSKRAWYLFHLIRCIYCLIVVSSFIVRCVRCIVDTHTHTHNDSVVAVSRMREWSHKERMREINTQTTLCCSHERALDGLKVSVNLITPALKNKSLNERVILWI